MKFWIGEQVSLKSGGPVMTIKSFSKDGMCWCVWFNSDADMHDLKSAEFVPDTLKKIDDKN